MIIDLAMLQKLMDSREDEHLEFKEAKRRYDFEELVKYCVALANEKGGTMVLGVTDQLPRRVVGSTAFDPIQRTTKGLQDRLHLRITGTELPHADGRVVVFDVPPRPIGMPIQYKGAYWMRSGDGLTPMTPDMLRSIFDESGPDYSAEVCRDASLDDIDPAAVASFREMWYQRSTTKAILGLSDAQLLRDAELILDDSITFAALILLGKRDSVSRYLSQSEVILEYRSSDASGAAQQRIEYREGFFLIHESLWNTINLRNDVQHFHEGLFVRDIRTFNEVAVREAILNAVAHRDYRMAGSIFLRQYPRRIEIVSPGGLPPGVTPENILWKQHPRNRRIAEVLAKCGLVERSGQGVNLMFEESVKESKPAPDFAHSDEYQVSLILNGVIQDPRFIRFLERVGQERLSHFSTEDFIVLDYLNREISIPDQLRDRLAYLADQGVVERIGRGRGVKNILSREFHDFVGKSGTYTRKRGLDRNTNKALLLKHIVDYRRQGSSFKELKQVLPDLSRNQIRTLLRELREDGKIRCEGRTRAAKWFPVTEW